MNRPQFLLLLFFSIPLFTKAQERELIYSPTFEWVDEKETITLHSFAGGGREYSYDKLVTQPLDKIDSVVVWVNGVREFIPSFALDENGQANIQIKEEADTLVFFARGEKSIFYHDAVMMQGQTRNFPIYFLEKTHVPIRYGFQSKPIRLSEWSYMVQRNYETCTSNEAWEKTVASWSKQYGGLVSLHSNHMAHLYAAGKSNAYISEVLRVISLHPHAAFVSVEVMDILANTITHFMSPNLFLYTEADAAFVAEQAKKNGFEILPDGNNGQRYELRYSKSKILGAQFIQSCSTLTHSLSAKYAGNNFYFEVRLD